ncbi:MAG TPA: carboxypeptidase regulatory-like domain-containing protein [Bryobacteraceae bacterium]|jgi:outer membrane receptor protein involved in Fe transport|nr:carboxypeptidase regulatory-like domain-containing protein [Bryobacteraceae bacterium]
MHSHRYSPRLLAFAALAIFFASGTSGQVVTGTLTGAVRDTTGATIPNARVTVTNQATGISQSTTTTSDGIYNLPYLGPGTYRIEIEAQGFKKFADDSVVINVSSTQRVDATLSPGNVQETVTVTGESPLLQTESAQVSRNFEAQTLRELPVANRNFQALAGLVPGVSPPVQNFTSLEDPQGTTFFNANGQGNSSNNTIVDGVDNINPTLGLSIYLPNPEVVEEVNVTTSNYSAEFGRVGGAVVNVITRSGTNDFHGSAWEFNRVAALAARDFFNQAPRPKPGLTRNEFGVTFGGPIKKDKAFFFFGYQGRYLRQSSTTTTTVPGATYFSGDFSSVPGLALYNPATGNPNGTGRAPFPNNIIPASQISPIAQKLNSYLPVPNLTGVENNYVVNVPYRYDGNQYDARVDYNFTEQTKMFALMNTSHYTVQQNGTLGNIVSDSTIGKDYTVTGIVNVTHGFSPTLLTELRLGYNRYRTNVNGIDMTTITNQKLGIANPNPDPISSQGFANIDIGGGMTELGNTQYYYPLVNTDNLMQVVDTWSKTLTKHTLKWGGEVHRNRMDRFQPQGLNLGPRGLFYFNPGTTQLNGGPGLGPYGSFINSFASYLIGATDQTSRTYMPITPTNRQWQVAGFLQDTYQATQKLTLDLGFRYEYYSPVVPRYKGGASNFDPYTNTLLVAGYGSVDLATGVGSQSMPEPRVGFAYRLDSKSVVRGGYAISGWTGRFGFTGGTLSTQYPVIYNVQVGNTGDYKVDGTFGSLPVVPLLPIPSNGLINPAPNQAFFVIPSRNRLPYVQNYNFTYERQFAPTMSWSVAYVGALGRELPFNQQLNAAAPGAGTAGLPFNVLFGRTASTSLRADGVNSNYNALQTDLTKRFSHGISFNIAYAFSKSLDVGSNQPGFTDNLNLRRQYGPSDFDQTHLLTISHILDLPFGKGRAFLNSGGIGAHILSNWQFNGIFRLATGTPFTATADATSCNCPGNNNFADAISPVHTIGGVGPGQPWFTKSSFAPPSPNQFGNAGRNTIRGPGLKNYDFSLFRTFAVSERFKLEFRGEFYNLTNTPHFSNPDGNVNHATFGIISSTLSGYGNRQVQTALRILF